jgi:tetratricopeptide (TPR) repeat protein
MKNKSLFMLSAMLVLLALLCSCSSDDNDGPPPPDPNALSAEGWTAYESGDFTNALVKFNEALGVDSNHIDARLGAGWCQIRLGSLQSAYQHLTNAIGNAPQNADVLAARTVAATLLNDFGIAVMDGSNFLQATSNGDSYVFAHDSTVQSRDVRILYALAAFHEGYYSTAQTQVVHLNPALTFDPTAPTYLAELIAAIEALMG